MAAPALFYCVGATKAGTSWLYRYLHDHPQCAMPAVKEAHYWDTFAADAREKQAGNYRVRLRELRQDKKQAKVEGRKWQVENLDRRINEMKALVDLLEGPRDDDQAYLDWLTTGRAGQITGDMTPNYATIDDDTLARMRDASPAAKFIFLIRDPLDRLWSHIRMQARRQRQDHEVYEKKSNNILHRMLNNGQETHILHRGDYPKIIRKLRRIIPEGRLLIQFTEDVFTPVGLGQLCAFLGISYKTPAVAGAVHEGPPGVIRDRLRVRAMGMLNEHYDWVARNVGPLPQRWHDNRARA